MRETEPDVHLIARPELNWPEVHRYLRSVGGEAWYERRAHERLRAGYGGDAQTLVEFAGRGCYRSWAPGLNANVTRTRDDQGEYLRNIVNVGHGSVLEHAQFTFVFQDVSRVFTHELVRHRAGVAISQESLRFVRLTDLGVRIPPILDDPTRTMLMADPDTGAMVERPVRAAIVDLVERVEDFQRGAAEAFGLDDEGVPFHHKKEVTSALRRLAPIGLSTMMTWSANVRTLRFVIEKRTAGGAEEEIRLVFNAVGATMMRACPDLFGDFELRPVEGSDLPAWVAPGGHV